MGIMSRQSKKQMFLEQINLASKKMRSQLINQPKHHQEAHFNKFLAEIASSCPTQLGQVTRKIIVWRDKKIKGSNWHCLLVWLPEMNKPDQTPA
jgi:hypothetical protein